MKKKKLLIFLPSLAGGGAERTVVNIMNFLDIDIFDVTLVLIAKDSKGDNKHEYINEINPNIKIKYLNCKLSKVDIFKIIIRLKKLLKIEAPDVIFSTTFNANIISIISNKLNKKRLPVIIRETTNRSELGASSINKLITKILYNQADAIISLSEGVKIDLVKNFNVEEEKIKLIYNPIDIEKINKIKTEKIENKILNISNTKIIIAVGRLIDAKDFGVLLKAFQIINTKIDSKLLILGKGPEEAKLKLLCEDLKIDKNVIFGGFKQNPYKYMKRADLFILSSKREGFAHVIAEAMTVGTPVIATDCNSGPREIILDNKYGKLVEVGNYTQMAEEAIDMLNNPKEYKRLSESGKKRAEFFEAEKIVKEYQNLFINTINNFNL